MINMFDIKSLGIKDYIIGGLLIVVLFLIYKYYTNSNKIKSLEDEINDLNNKIKENNKIMNNSETDNNYETDNNSEIDDNTINYKTIQTLETFNNTKIETNTKKNNIECNEDFCYINKLDEKNNIYPSQQMNNLSKEVDNIIKSDVYIPIDLKQIINNVYNFPEIDEDDNEDDIDEDVDVEYNNNNFNPIIINNEIKITQDDIEKNNIIQIPDFINIPLNFENQLLDEIKNVDEQKINVDELVSEKNIELDEVVSEKKSDIELNKISKDEESNEKIKNMKINDIKNLAKEFNIKVTENGKPKNKDQLVKEITECKNKTSNI